jgi:putative membrane protein
MKTVSRSIWVVIAILIGLGLLVGGFLLSRSGWSMYGYGPGLLDGNFGFGMMNGFGFGGIFMILFWIVIIGLGVWLVSRLTSSANSQPPSNSATSPESALDILKKRYARGEITQEQYQAMRRDLTE